MIDPGHAEWVPVNNRNYLPIESEPRRVSPGGA